MNGLPQTIDLDRLGIRRDDFTSAEPICSGLGGTIYRVRCGGKSFVLKWFADSAGAIEVGAYALLCEYGIPTLPVHGQTENALLLEDLGSSDGWRLATALDMESPGTGRAVAEWYRFLHSAGSKAVLESDWVAQNLKREADALSPSAIIGLGERFGLGNDPVWSLAASHIGALQQKLRSLPETLNYNDFHWTNLALSRSGPLQAIVFDYHLLGIGPACSDCRNVLGSLGEKAKLAFLDTYGPLDEEHAVFDRPMSVLYSLSVAAEMPKWPGWADACLDHLRQGGLEKDLRAAVRKL